MDQNKHKTWNPIRDMLKEKYSSANNQGNTTKDFSNGDYWNKFQEITGKSKEQFQNQLKTF